MIIDCSHLCTVSLHCRAFNFHLVLKLPLLARINHRYILKAFTELLDCSSILESIRYLTYQKYGYRMSEAQPNSTGIDFLYDHRPPKDNTATSQVNIEDPFQSYSTPLGLLSSIKLLQYTSPTPCLHHLANPSGSWDPHPPHPMLSPYGTPFPTQNSKGP